MHPFAALPPADLRQTLKRWLTKQPRAGSVAALQTQLDAFRGYYNTARPHWALHRRTPAEVFAARPKAQPPAGPVIDGHYRIRHDKIDPSGVITLRHNSRLHHIGIGRAHAGTRVLVLAADLHIRIVTTDGELLRELTLDPTRDYQRQAKRE
jgi:Integrase core domain